MKMKRMNVKKINQVYEKPMWRIEWPAIRLSGSSPCACSVRKPIDEGGGLLHRRKYDNETVCHFLKTATMPSGLPRRFFTPMLQSGFYWGF
jgi:hypothetical protein